MEKGSINIFPEKYSLEDQKHVTSVLAQSSTNCWAYSSSSVLESYLLIHKKTSLDGVCRLSPMHATYDAYDMDPFTPEYANNRGRRVPETLSHETEKSQPFYNYPGSRSTISNYYSHGGGVHLNGDINVKFEVGARITPRRWTITANKPKNYLVTDLNYLPEPVGTPPDNAFLREVKYHIMVNSAVGCTLWYDPATYMQSHDIPNSEKKEYCYYSTGKSKTGSLHSVAIIGWDDTYPASYFKTTPPTNGAFLIKDSYKNEKKGTLVYEGKFWLSYADTSISLPYSISSVDDTIWTKPVSCLYHDCFGYQDKYEYSKDQSHKTINFSNVFPCEDNDWLTAVGIFAPTPCLVKVGVVCGQLTYTVIENMHLEYAGFHVVHPARPISLSKGDFQINVTFDSIHDINVYAPIELKVDQTYINMEQHIAYGKSFIEGIDICKIRESHPKYGNVPIRAYVEHRSADALSVLAAYNALQTPKPDSNSITSLPSQSENIPIEWRLEPWCFSEYAGQPYPIEAHHVTLEDVQQTVILNTHTKKLPACLNALLTKNAVTMSKEFNIPLEPVNLTGPITTSEVKEHGSTIDLSGEFPIPGATVYISANGVTKSVKVDKNKKWNASQFNLYDFNKGWQDSYANTLIKVDFRDDDGISFCTSQTTVSLTAPIKEETDASGKINYKIWGTVGFISALVYLSCGKSASAVQIAAGSDTIYLMDDVLYDMGSTGIEGPADAPANIETCGEKFGCVKYMRNLIFKVNKPKLDSVKEEAGDVPVGAITAEIADGGDITNCQITGVYSSNVPFGGILGRGKNITIKDTTVDLQVNCPGSCFSGIARELNGNCTLENVSVKGTLIDGACCGIAEKIESATMNNVTLEIKSPT